MKNWKIRNKLLVLTSVLIGFIVLAAGSGYFGMQATVRGLETVYLDRVVPLRDLKVIADMYAVNIVDTSHKARAGALTHAEALQQIEKAQTTIDERWKAYVATRLTPEEEKVVAEVEPMMAAAEAPLQQLKGILRQGDAEALAAFTSKDLYPLIDPFSDAFARLMEIQLTEAKLEYDASEDIFHSNQLFNLVVAALAVLVGGALSAVVTRQITSQLGAEPGELELAATDIANGRLAGMPGGGHASLGVMGSVDRMRSNLHEIVAHIADDSKRLGASAATLASASEQVAARTEVQGEASASMAAALEELSVSIAGIADSTNDAKRVAAHANAVGQSGLQVIQAAIQDFDRIDRLMSDSAQRVNRLSDDSKSIGTIGSVIREIADQTNLLALNAAIEAARAGEQGRGFAVVADEVRKLAERTSASTAEIVQLVTTIQEGTSSTREQMNAVCGQVGMSKQHIREAGDTMAELRDALAQTLMNVESISLSLNEQRTASTEVASRVEQVAQAVEETSATQKEIGLAAQDLDKLASGLNSMVARFAL